MAHHSQGYFSKFMLCFIIFMIMFEFSIGDEVEATTATTATVDDHHQEENKPVGVTTEYWEKAKLLHQQTHGGNEGGEGSAGKMTAAVGKSMEKSKSTVGESAKTATKFAEDTPYKTTYTVKKATGFSSSEEDKTQTQQTPHPEFEL